MFAGKQLRRWVGRRQRDASTTLPVLQPLRVDEQVIPLDPEQEVFIRLPEFFVLLHVDFLPSGDEGKGRGPCVRRVRLSIPDPTVRLLLDAATEQIKQVDLREVDGNLSGFTEPLNVQFRIDVHWLDAYR